MIKRPNNYIRVTAPKRFADLASGGWVSGKSVHWTFSFRSGDSVSVGFVRQLFEMLRHSLARAGAKYRVCKWDHDWRLYDIDTINQFAKKGY